jgi:hypothetical protein
MQSLGSPERSRRQQKNVILQSQPGAIARWPTSWQGSDQEVGGCGFEYAAEEEVRFWILTVQIGRTEMEGKSSGFSKFVSKSVRWRVTLSVICSDIQVIAMPFLFSEMKGAFSLRLATRRPRSESEDHCQAPHRHA